MSDNKSKSLGLADVLFIVFLVLKLTNTIDWSWWWVTSPLWLPIAIVLALLIIITIINTIREY